MSSKSRGRTNVDAHMDDTTTTDKIAAVVQPDEAAPTTRARFTATSPQIRIGPLPIEAIRFRGEAAAAAAVRADRWLQDLVVAAEARGTAGTTRTRRKLAARGRRLTRGTAPDVWAALYQAADRLGLPGPFEVHETLLSPDPAIHLVREPILLEVRLRLLALLDEASTVAAMGRALGHHLAHGADAADGLLGTVIHTALEHPGVPEASVQAAARLSMARAITADRFGLIAAGELAASLRLEMASTTGLAAGALTWDATAYLAQCRALVEAAGAGAPGASFPEHGIRAWALWLFSETDLFRRLTGRGPEARSIDDVDAQISRVLGATGVDGLIETALSFEPIPEIHECALAASALVALADSQLAEAEIRAIEKVFAPLVGDWQRYLEWDHALEAFADTGSVVIAGGPLVQRSVFQVLVHVLAADAEVEGREIDMICAIGDALEAGPLFRALLAPVLKALGEEPRELDLSAQVIPIPARPSEAETALTVFLRGIHRRGGGEATLRRMYRLLGDREGTQTSRSTVSRILTSVGLQPQAELDDAPLDQPIALDLTPEAAQERYAEAPTVRMRIPVEQVATARQRLGRGLARLREALVSGDGRSPSVRLRQARLGRAFDLHDLEQLSVGHGERVLALVMGAQDARVVDGREVGVHPLAKQVSQQLVALHREAIARYEQKGARDLYVGHPFLTGMIGGYLVRGPLVLHPYELSRTEARGFSLVPRAGEARVVNQALVRLLFSKKGVPFPEDLAEALDRAAADDLGAVRRVLADSGLPARPEGDALAALIDREAELKDWPDGRVVLEPCAVLGFFPQSTSDMIQDYDALLAAVGNTRVPLADKLGAAGSLLPADLRDELCVTELPADDSDAPIVPVVPADPSQRSVLARARGQRVLVVDGPPGTGKSQVIVNLVADALARGKTVAVVCEKRAALDVVAQRLESVGLRHLLAVVHDVHDDRRPLYKQVIARLGEEHSHDLDPADAASVEAQLEQTTDALSRRRRALLLTLGQGHPSVGQLHLLAASFEGTPLVAPEPELIQLPAGAVQRLAEQVGQEAAHADLHRRGSVWRPPEGKPERPSLADTTPEQLARIQGALRAAKDTAKRLHDLESAQGVRARYVAPATDAIRAALATGSARRDRGQRELFAAWLDRGDDPALAVLVRRLATAWADVELWQEVVPEPISERSQIEITEDVRMAMAVTRSWGSSALRWMSIAWWRARTVLQTTLVSQWPTAASSTVDARLVERIEARSSGSEAWLALRKLLEILGIEPILPDTATAVVWVERIVETFGATRPVVEAESVLRKAEAWPETRRAAALEPWERALHERLAMIEAAKQHAAAFRPARGCFPWQGACPSLRVVAALHEAWATDAPRVVASDHNLDQATELYPGARQLVRSLADAHGGARAERAPGVGGGTPDWADAIEHGWAVGGLEQLERRFPALRALDREPEGQLPRLEAELAQLVTRRGALQVQRILAAADRVPLLTEARPERGGRETPLQKAREQMLREARKRRHILSLRGFVRQFADQGLMELLPVWLLSPETIAVLFPGQPIFDLVVMDEASQCTVEKGLPALMRGHQAVIAGDDKQMPPTSFFELKGSDEGEIGTEDTVEADALTAESLLVLARERCVHEGLRWHYRCLREELIAFSNHAMYGGDLFTVPSVATDRARPALRWEAVEGARYEGGANPVEAARVVELLGELLGEEIPPSVGVVTFNIQQRQTIQDTIDARIDADPAFAEAYARASGDAALDRRPFVKNLEAVQGDERDVIIFSLGHAPVARSDGSVSVPARFGPLGQAGGERRLNVAVSRAKATCVVVASFEPSMLSVANTKHPGPKLLKAFLQYAWDLNCGRRLAADKTLDRVRSGGLGDAPHRARGAQLGVPSLASQIATCLDARGIAYDLGVGTSGFRVPLAIVDPRDPTTYRIAVLTDAGEPERAGAEASVIEAHLHQPRVLEARGWRVIRVDSRSWHRDREAVLGRIVALAEGAGQGVGVRSGRSEAGEE